VGGAFTLTNTLRFALAFVVDEDPPLAFMVFDFDSHELSFLSCGDEMISP